MKILARTTVFLCLGLSACGSPSGMSLPPTDRQVELDRHFAERAAQLQWIRHADPLVDAERALASEDARILGVYGYSVSFPGLVPGFYPTEQCQWRAIEGTGDFVNRELAELQSLAVEYAAAYNRRVLPASGCTNEPFQAH